MQIHGITAIIRLPKPTHYRIERWRFYECIRVFNTSDRQQAIAKCREWDDDTCAVVVLINGIRLDCRERAEFKHKEE